MKIYLGADHGGFKLKETIKKWLSEKELDVVDCGAEKYTEGDDYPIYAFEVGEKVVKDEGSVGILFCRSGGGMSIAANKVNGVRAVDVFDLTSAAHARTNNDCNIITFGGDWMDPREAQVVIENFLNLPFRFEERHVRRIEMITRYEKAH